MQGFERRWLLEASWKLQVEEGEEGWSVREAAGEDATGERPLRWSDATGAFGAASDEFRLVGRSGTWDLRIYASPRVVSATRVPGGRLRLPEGWWMVSEEDRSASALGFGAPGTSLVDLERSERRGWEAWVPSAVGGIESPVLFSVLGGWHHRDVRHGDTEILHRMAPIGGEAFLRDRLRGGGPNSSVLALDCRNLVAATDTVDGLADGFLFAHQAFGARWLCWDAPPDAVVVDALERAHMDAQGELFGVWVAGGTPIPARASWRRLGPVLRPSERVPDCYVWER